MSLPTDYFERVYAGVLGKIIGVYLGRPFEGWPHQAIMEQLGEVWYYVHERLGQPLIVTDDDISGTFTFLRALADNGYSRELTPQQIAQTWLNYIIEQRTILWWGGLGRSTEHTAYLRLKNGVAAPRSGSMALNGQVVAEQIGAQIFIDGWAMVAPGDPAFAADLAGRAASVSHDGEAVYAAQALAAMESIAFTDTGLNDILDTGLAVIPDGCLVARLINDLREWHAAYPQWLKAREKLEAEYGYEKYGGGCHVIPNHGVVILSLLYGEDDFQRTLMIANTAGWDTDCNSGNVGCLMGIKNGLAGLQNGPDWRGPIADRLYLPTADGGRAVSDALHEALHVVNAGRALAGESPLRPKHGARYHFSLPGAVQGFQADAAVRDMVSLQNVPDAEISGSRRLAIHYRHLAPGRTAYVSTPTFIPPEALAMPGYALLASPTLYPGQMLRASVTSSGANSLPVAVRLYLRYYDADNTLQTLAGQTVALDAGEEYVFLWQVPDLEGAPIAEVGLALESGTRADGTLYLEWLTWDGIPDITFTPLRGAETWQRAWVNAADVFEVDWDGVRYTLIQNSGTGLALTGTRQWTDYSLRAVLNVHLAARAGIAARAQGLRRWYGLLLCRDAASGVGVLRLVKALDGDEQVLAETPFQWGFGTDYDLRLDVQGRMLRGWVGEQMLLEHTDTQRPLLQGGVALLVEEGRLLSGPVLVMPLAAPLEERASSD